jgi:hypothetical protein
MIVPLRILLGGGAREYPVVAGIFRDDGTVTSSDAPFKHYV